MSKIFNSIKAFFVGIYKIIDKVFVVPVSRLVYRLNEVSKNNSGKFERILNRPNVLIYVSLFCAIAIFLLIDTKSISLVNDEAEVLTDQPVNIIYNEEAYVIDGIPKTADVMIKKISSRVLRTRMKTPFAKHLHYII